MSTKEVIYTLKMPIELVDYYDAAAIDMDTKPDELMLDILSRYAVPMGVINAEIKIKEAKIQKLKEIQKWLEKLRSEKLKGPQRP